MKAEREIKFRAWSKEHKRMFSNDLFEQSAGGLLKIAKRFAPNLPHGKEGLYLPLKDDDLIFMQFTGLRDKNGQEIYEGDIVNFRHSFEPEYSLDATVVEWVPQWCRFCIGWNVSLNSNMNLEVIGNIYENPELLQGS